MSKREGILNAAKISTPVMPRSNSYFGMILFLVSEAFLFGALFWTYYYLRATTPVWLPEGVHLDRMLAIVNTALLLSSSAVVWWAARAIRQGNQKGLLTGLALTMTLGLAFLGITVFEWMHESFRPWTNAYGSIFYTLTGFHALHVLGGIVLMLALYVRALKRRISSANYQAVEIGSLYWHYVDFIWIIVFSTLFIVK